ncbi:MAG: GTP-sensing pleiotropic transcriptional regulator CodY [Lachnospiraceae bacterium]|nr:GTP-sensing pleiotropic transcriptional regulator CodY [Lachnospiraceae bacterium]
MSVELLDKTRKIGRLLHNNNSSKVVFNDICQILSDTLLSSAAVISRKGKVLGGSVLEEENGRDGLLDTPVGAFISPVLNERILSILSTKENASLETLGFEGERVSEASAILSPILIAGERLGTLFIYRFHKPYGIDDIILCEYGATVVGLEMVRSQDEENAEESRKKEIVESAIRTLSYSEQEAIIHVLEALDGTEGILVASKIADTWGITRSVIVNALRKFESAGVIESRSSGMKGTYIKVKNEIVFSEMKKLKSS